MQPAFDVVLFDVGGTLWPDVLEDMEESRVPGMMAALGSDRCDDAVEVMEHLERTAEKMITENRASGKDDIRRLIGDVLRAHALSPSAQMLEAVRRAMVVPAEEGWLFTGASELLQAVQRLGLRSGVVSNTVWRDHDDYRSDFHRLGVAELVPVIVTSIDAGVRKPHPGIFRLALDGLATTPDRTVFVGNSEAADIAPTRELGMYAIRVAMEESLPASSQADVVVGSLWEVREAIQSVLRPS